MAEVQALFEIEIRRSPKGSRNTSSELYQQLKLAIIDGRLKAGSQLPATRLSDAVFGASRNTLAEVYRRLIAEGLARGRHGSGTYVSGRHHGTARRNASPPAGDDTRLNPFWLTHEVSGALNFWRESADQATPSARESTCADFRPAMIDSRLFPLDKLRLVMARQLRELEKKPSGRKSAQGNQGNYHLRHAITEHIALARAVVCDMDDIIVTSGAQQAFDLLARVLVTPRKTVVAVEDPGYPPMRVAFSAAGAQILPIGVDSEGLMVERLPGGVNVICVCPSHHFPLGVTMSKRRRAALVEYARRHRAVIIEDDYDGEFRFEGQPLEALRCARHADVVFYVGTFSKCMLPALRLGFIVAPRWAMPSLIVAKNSLDWHCPTLIQGVVAKFIAGGHLRRHVRRMRETYASRRHLLLATLLESFGEWLVPIPSFYGMHVAARARGALDLERLAKAAHGRGVMIHTLSRYFLGEEKQSGLVFGYGVTDLAEMRLGLSELGRLLNRQYPESLTR